MKKALTLVLLSGTAFTARAEKAPALPPKKDPPAAHTAGPAADKASRIGFSGYLQVQWQWGREKGQAAPFAGGDFPARSDNRFTIRRGRLKAAYEGRITRAVLQLDLTEKKIGIKDLYLSVTAPSQTIGGTAGVFNRPFGQEIAYSSSLRESPERSRLFQTLFPGERDIGVQLSLRGPEGHWSRALDLKAGLFTGNGIHPETDAPKDFIGRLGFEKNCGDLRFGLGASLYRGKVLHTTDSAYRFDRSARSFRRLTGVKEGYALRSYWGMDALLQLRTGIGSLRLHGEIVGGRQPGQENSSVSPTAAFPGPVYQRRFFGYVLDYAQDLGRTPLSAVVRVDRYDPNTRIRGRDIGKAGSRTGAADLAYTTLGTGLLWHIDRNLRLTAYYDRVWNEKSPHLASAERVKDFSRDVPDDLFTLRLQCKF